ncbi:MAG: SRPBCC family protein [Actinomycetota bacterium]|jgi:hypothetical protein|nr:SRPBCC family protein [Actinomycetota bacterium]
MPKVQRAILLSHTTADVWSVLSEFGNISAWGPNVDHSCIISDVARGVGAVRRVQTARTTVLETVTEWSDGDLLSYSIVGLPPVIRSVSNTWSLEPIHGGTNVRLTSDIRPGQRPPHRIAAAVVGRRLGSASDQMLGGLSAFLNGRAAVTGDGE